MDLQKRKSTKKLKESKSEAQLQIPLAPLYHEINQLKSQLASIKAKKVAKVNTYAQNQKQRVSRKASSPTLTAKNLPQQQKVGTQREELAVTQPAQPRKQVIFPLAEYEARLNSEIDRLHASVASQEQQKAICSINRLVSVFNVAVRELEKSSYGNQCLPSDGHGWREQLRVYQQLNKELDRENIEYRHLAARQADEISRLESISLQASTQCDILARSLKGYEDEIGKLKLINEGLREEREQLEQKIRVYERSIEKKQSDIVMAEQDISYNRMESQKHRAQKKELEKMYQDLLQEHKETKARLEAEVEGLAQQKYRWQKECENRRAADGELLEIEEHKTVLKKDVEKMRKNTNLLTQELNATKRQVFEQTKKNMALEQQIYHLNSEKQKLDKMVELYKAEISSMHNEVNELQQEASRLRNLSAKKPALSSLNKNQALSQIQELIELHKRELQ